MYYGGEITGEEYTMQDLRIVYYKHKRDNYLMRWTMKMPKNEVVKIKKCLKAK